MHTRPLAVQIECALRDAMLVLGRTMRFDAPSKRRSLTQTSLDTL